MNLYATYINYYASSKKEICLLGCREILRNSLQNFKKNSCKIVSSLLIVANKWIWGSCRNTPSPLPSIFLFQYFEFLKKYLQNTFFLHRLFSMFMLTEVIECKLYVTDYRSEPLKQHAYASYVINTFPSYRADRNSLNLEF